jgi:hypothetical protein
MEFTLAAKRTRTVMLALLFAANGAALAVERDNPDDIILGDDTRQRRLNFETVSGRKLNFADGRAYIFKRDYTATFSRTGISDKRGKWSLIGGDALSIDYENGDQEQMIFITISGEPYLRYLFKRDSRIQSGGVAGKNILQKEILRIKSVVAVK